MSTTTVQAVECPSCRERVIVTTRPGLTVDAAVTAGGLYELDGRIPLRRAIKFVATEYRMRDTIYGGGHEKHECPAPESWVNR